MVLMKKCSSKPMLFEDDPRNLVEPFKMGMKTALIGDFLQTEYIHFNAPDLNTFFANELNG